MTRGPLTWSALAIIHAHEWQVRLTKFITKAEMRSSSTRGLTIFFRDLVITSFRHQP